MRFIAATHGTPPHHIHGLRLVDAADDGRRMGEPEDHDQQADGTTDQLPPHTAIAQ